MLVQLVSMEHVLMEVAFEARLAQCISVTRVRLPVLSVSCGLSFLLVLALLRGFFSGFSGFHPSTKTNTSKFQFDLDEVFEDPSVNHF